jgi:hypothetical protein
MIIPILNINGSSADDLINPRLDAIAHLKKSIEALLKVIPNGRDYSDSALCNIDRNEHYDRIQNIHDIWNEIYNETIAIKQQERKA